MIYKYLDEKTLQPITDQTLKFATVEDLNDPFENLARITPIEEPIEEQIERLKQHEEFADLLKDVPASQHERLLRHAFESSKQLFDGTTHHTPTLFNQIELQKRTSDTLGILSLTSSPTNSLMWSHYANMHQGYVIGFDDKHKWFNATPQAGKYLQKLLPVTYSTSRIEFDGPDLTTKSTFAPFFQKSHYWIYEKEHRVLYPLSLCSQPDAEKRPWLYVRKFPVEMIREVIFGFRCPKDIVKKITTSLKGQNIRFLRATPSSISYDTVLTPEEDYQSLEEYETKLKQTVESTRAKAP